MVYNTFIFITDSRNKKYQLVLKFKNFFFLMSYGHNCLLHFMFSTRPINDQYIILVKLKTWRYFHFEFGKLGIAAFINTLKKVKSHQISA